MSISGKKTLLVLSLIVSVLIVVVVASQFLNKTENMDSRSEASEEQDADQNSSPQKKYGVLIMNNKPFDGSYSDEKSKVFLDIVDANYDSVMTQYGRMHAMHRDSRDNYNWDLVDPIVNWADENDKDVLWHNMIIHSNKIDDPQYKALHWYQNLPTDEERLEALEEHVRTVIKHYDGKVDMYHLINHFLFFDGDGNYMNTGKDIEELMVLAFTWANEESDDTIYIANAPTGAMTVESTKDFTIERVNRVNSQLPEGSKIDVIGIMGHFGRCSGEIPSIDRIDSYLSDIYAQTGVPIQISEFDISYDSELPCDNPKVNDPYSSFTTKDGSTYGSWFEYQAEAYKKLYDLFAEHEAIVHIFQWGFYDGDHRRAHAGLFFGPDEGDKANDLDPKPAYNAIKDLTCSDLCSDRECGYDGCGGSCGTCTGDLVCDNQYKCSENQCTPDCDNKQCGDDGCGGSCGTCDNGKVCDNQQQCVEQQCTPNCDGKDCGDDGCGGSCGNCQDGYSCNNVFKCEEDPQECVPKCDVRECGNDGCGGSCGDCGSGYVCATDYTCAARPACTPQCDSRECGADGCGGSCGSCGSGYVCNSSYQCVVSQSQCTPSCTGKSCGSDGCGGYCGTCGSGYTCSSDFRCVVATVGGGGDVGKDGTKLPDTATGKEIAIIALGFGLLSTSIVLYTSGVVREKRSVRSETFKRDF